jgi:SAM-dependent methyltransferase
MKSNHNGFGVQNLLRTRVEEHFGDRSFPVYQSSEDAKLGRILMDWDRIVFTLGVIEKHFSDPANIKVLELGANPYFLTQMIQDRFGSEMHTNGCPLGLTEDDEEIRSGIVSFESSAGGEQRPVENRLFNVEEDRYPYDDSSFDLVICQELIEHLLFSPTFMLNEIHRVLKKGGKLIMTCPNVARIDVLRKVLTNKNPIWGYVKVVDKSGRRNSDWPGSHGVYGRHNREYTLAEATDLARGCGFKILESECLTFHLPKVQASLGHPLLFLQTLIYRSMKSATFLPLKFLQLKKDFVFIAAEKDRDTPVEYYPPSLYDVWQVQHDETAVSSGSLNI